MSSSHDSSGKPIPMGILVKPATKIDRFERPAPRRRTEGAPSGEKQIPWLWLAIGGSAAWVVLVLTVALLTRNQETAQEIANPPLPRLVAVDGPLANAAPAPKAVNAVNANDPGEAAEPMPMPMPKARLVPKQVLVNDGPPPIDIPPEEQPKQLVPVVARNRDPVAPATRVKHKDLDLKVFANCEQIGTNVLFVKEPPQAFLRAKDEKKMVFMVHLSGNLEDPGFT
jgi:hypothetical protein